MRAVALALTLAALVAASAARAGEIGHYAGGLMNIRDLAVPEPGLFDRQEALMRRALAALLVAMVTAVPDLTPLIRRRSPAAGR